MPPEAAHNDPQDELMDAEHHIQEKLQKAQLEVMRLKHRLEEALDENSDLKNRLERSTAENVRLAEENLQHKRNIDKETYFKSAVDTLRNENERLAKQVKSLQNGFDKIRHNKCSDFSDDESADFDELDELRKKLNEYCPDHNERVNHSKAVMTVVSNASLESDRYHTAMDSASRTVYFPKAADSKVPPEVHSVTELDKPGHFKLFSSDELAHFELGNVFGFTYRCEYIKVRGSHHARRHAGRVSSKKDMFHPEEIVTLLRHTRESYEEQLEEERYRQELEISTVKYECASQRKALHEQLAELQKNNESLKDEVFHIKKTMTAKSRDTMKHLMKQMKNEMDIALQSKDRKIEDILSTIKSKHENKKFTFSFSGSNLSHRDMMPTLSSQVQSNATPINQENRFIPLPLTVDRETLTRTLRAAEALSDLTPSITSRSLEGQRQSSRNGGGGTAA